MVGAHAQDVGPAGRPAQLGEVGAAAGELASGFRAVGGDDEHLVPPRRLVGVRQQAAIGRPRRGSDVAARFVTSAMSTPVERSVTCRLVQLRSSRWSNVEATRVASGDTLRLAPIAVAAGEQHRPRISDVDHGERGRLVPRPAPVDGDHQPALIEPHRRRPVAERRRRTAAYRGDDHLAAGGEGDPHAVRRDCGPPSSQKAARVRPVVRRTGCPPSTSSRPHVRRVAVEGEGDELPRRVTRRDGGAVRWRRSRRAASAAARSTSGRPGLGMPPDLVDADPQRCGDLSHRQPPRNPTSTSTTRAANWSRRSRLLARTPSADPSSASNAPAAWNPAAVTSSGAAGSAAAASTPSETTSAVGSVRVDGGEQLAQPGEPGLVAGARRQRHVEVQPSPAPPPRSSA